MSVGSYMNGIAKKKEEHAGKIAQALKEKKLREEVEDIVGWFPEDEPYKICPLEEGNAFVSDNKASTRCSTINELRTYLFGMRDVLDATPDNDYEQGQLSVINKLLDVTREDS